MPEFHLQLSGFMLFAKRVMQFGGIVIALSGIIESFKIGNIYPLIVSILNGGFYFLIATYAIKTFPRKISVESNSLIFYKVPTTWFNIGPILVPLGITQRLTIEKASVVIECIGKSITLNDMTAGKTIPLASGKEGERLLQWLARAGVANPVGG